MNADGSGSVNLTNDPNYDLDPGWAPDGTKIAYARVLGDRTDIRVMSSDGSGKVTITSSGNNYNPDWQPSGQAPTTFELTVTRQGRGSGTVSSSPAGIQCGTDCSQGVRERDARHAERHSGGRVDVQGMERRVLRREHVRRYDGCRKDGNGEVRSILIFLDC